MKSSSELDIRGTVVRVMKIDGEDFICLTDMLKAKDGDFFVTDWLRNRNTLEFIGIWKQVYNPNFNYGEFATIRGQAGLNSFKIGVQEFVQRTHAICLCSKAGRYGGTYAHKDIAFEFAMWISAEFKIYIWLLRRGRPVRPPPSTGFQDWQDWQDSPFRPGSGAQRHQRQSCSFRKSCHPVQSGMGLPHESW